MQEPVDYAVHTHVATITLNRPEKRNALSTEVLLELIDAFKRADAAADVRVVVLTGAGDKVFCAGGDLEKFLGEQAATPGKQGGAFVELFETMAGLGKPIVGRINGHCLAGAFGVALGCDLLVAVDHAEFGTPEIQVGLWPMMISALIYRNLPRKIANELMLTGRRLKASEALALGIVNRVATAGDFDAAVEQLTSSLAKHPPTVVRLGRRALYAQQDMPFLEALKYLEQGLRDVLGTADAAEGIRAFLEKRPPVFTGK